MSRSSLFKDDEVRFVTVVIVVVVVVIDADNDGDFIECFYQQGHSNVLCNILIHAEI